MLKHASTKPHKNAVQKTFQTLLLVPAETECLQQVMQKTSRDSKGGNMRSEPTGREGYHPAMLCSTPPCISRNGTAFADNQPSHHQQTVPVQKQMMMHTASKLRKKSQRPTLVS